MPAYFDDSVLDAALGVLDNATDLYVCSGPAPTTRAEVIASELVTIALQAGDYTIGNATPDGRGLTVAAQAGVPVTGTGTPVSYCLIDATLLLARTDVDPSSPDLTTGSTADIPAVVFSVADPIVI